MCPLPMIEALWMQCIGGERGGGGFGAEALPIFRNPHWPRMKTHTSSFLVEKTLHVWARASTCMHMRYVLHV